MLPAGMAVLMFFYAQTAWWHWHLLPNGTLVGHAHPYQQEKANGPFQQHQHGSNQLAFLSLYSSGSATFNAYNPLISEVQSIIIKHPVFDTHGHALKETSRIPSLRAPPSLVFI